MPIVQAYQCAHTGKLFLDKSEYVQHLRKLSSGRLAKRKLEKARSKHQQTLAEMRRTVQSIPELEDWIVSHNDVLSLNAIITDVFGRYKPDQKIPIVTISNVRFNVAYSPACSNSHSAPIGKQTNWGGRKAGVPRGYPGWRGSLKFKVIDRIRGNSYGGSDFFTRTGINTGTGGGGSTKFGYDVTLFSDDWPGLARTAMLNKLADNSYDIQKAFSDD